MQAIINITVSNAHDAPASRLQKFTPGGIVISRTFATVGITIDFHNQLGGNAGEVGNVATNRMLAAQLDRRMAAQLRPQNDFRFRHLAP